MSEIELLNISIAHRDNEIVKMFDDREECLKFADEFYKKYNIKLKCDSIWSFNAGIESKGWHRGYKEGRQDAR